MDLSLRTSSIEIQEISDASVSLLILKPPAPSHEIIPSRPLPKLCAPSMHSRAPTPSESSPLISSPHDHRPSDPLERPIPDSPNPEVFRVSRIDLVWILAGLWSAVFLGALDGKHRRAFLPSQCYTICRHDCCHPYGANR
jgi:hypothetical protein